MFGLIGIIIIAIYFIAGMYITYLYMENGGGKQDLEGFSNAEKMLFTGVIFPLIIPIMLIFFYLFRNGRK